MAFKTMTMAEILASPRKMDMEKIAATTEEDIRRYQIEDGEDPDAPLPPFEVVHSIRSVRTKLQMTLEDFAAAIDVPLETVRDWELLRTRMEPAMQSLLRAIDREPEVVLRALAKRHVTLTE